MILSSMLFLTVVSVFAGAAALLADRGLAPAGLPTRWIWIAGLAAGPALLVAPLLVPDDASRGLGQGVGAATFFELPPLLVAAGDGRVLPVDELAGLLWAVSMLFAGTFFLRSHLALERARGGWVPTTVQGREVLVSDDVGPAVAGLLRPRIVLPRWALDLGHRDLELVLLHEEEHARARDTALLGAAWALAALTPWNPGAWWMGRRLRTAMEIDCDRRVLRREPDRGRYGESLLTVAGRRPRPLLGLAAFSESTSALERRIVTMTTKRTPKHSLRAGAFTLAASLLMVQACGVESPVVLQESELAVVEAPGQDPARTQYEAQEANIREAPTFTPFTTAPSIVNRDEVIRIMTESYPPLLKEAGVGGTTRVYFLINETGAVDQVRLDQSSGHPALDDAALNVAGAYRFSPAKNGDEPVPVWVSFPITFQVR